MGSGPDRVLRPRAGLRSPVRSLWRVLSITATVFAETKAASRAAALSFSSLLGLGPLIALAMPVAGLILGQRSPERAIAILDRAVRFVAPQVDQLDQVSGGGPVAHTPQLASLIDGVIAGADSGSAGLVGALSLIVIVLLLFKSFEDVFNEIWGVRRGRPWLVRVVFYWTLLTLGAAVFFAAVALMGAGAFVNVFVARLPHGGDLLRLVRWLLPVGSFLILVGVLTLFYRIIPNTRVYWRSALAGAVVVGLLLLLNNFLAFLYLSRVIQTRSFYGSLGLFPVLMFGLYVFWLYVLIGGQISYAVQNARFRSSKAAWATLSVSTRERLAVAVLMATCRRFRACLPPSSASDLGQSLRVPAQVLNECLTRLVDMRLVTPVPPAPGSPAAELLYQPARPLDRITLRDFKAAADNLGDNPLGEGIDFLDPVARAFGQALVRTREDPFFTKSVEQLLSEENPTRNA